MREWNNIFRIINKTVDRLVMRDNIVYLIHNLLIDKNVYEYIFEYERNSGKIAFKYGSSDKG